jgi:hypothetical protein
MPKYQSDVTVFLEKLKAAKPALEQGQQAGRALLWDKEPTTPEDQRRLKAAKLKQRAYVYSNE